MSATRLLLLLLVLATPAAAQAPTPQPEQGALKDPVPSSPLLDALRASRDPLRQIPLIDAIGRAAEPPPGGAEALLAVVQDADNDWSVRGEALAVLRRIDAPDDVVAQAVAAAGAATGEHAGYLRGQAIALRAWQDARANKRGAPAENPADAERRARLLLKNRGMEASLDGLTRAVAEGQSGTVSVLMTAGLSVGGNDAARATTAVVNGLATACAREPVPFLGVAQSLSVLVEHGMPPELPDESGNTLLMSAAQFCPAPIAARLLQLGVHPGPVNKQHWTPLQMALVGGKWDVVAVLVDAGARITPVEAGQIFMQPPQAQAERDLLARATKPE